MRAVLMSVTDKTGLTDFARRLKGLFPELKIIASGNTAKMLAEEGLNPLAVEEITRFPECFGGRVKTLHPQIMGGILFKRGKDEEEAAKLGIGAIDMVVCNLYNFKVAAKNPDLTVTDLIEQIDIGGSTLIRSSVKNMQSVAVVVDPNDYDAIVDELGKGPLTEVTRERLAVKAINASADYDALIAETLSSRLGQEEVKRPTLIRGRKLRYGENPDQEAWVYSFRDQKGLADATLISGKELSYNNYAHATVAYQAAESLKKITDEYGVAVCKHGSICGMACADNQNKAFTYAWEGDAKSAFGSIVAFTKPVESNLKEILKGKFVEVLIAPHFDASFVEWAKRAKPNLRLVEITHGSNPEWIYRNIHGGMLIQSSKAVSEDMDSLIQDVQEYGNTKRGVVTRNKPSKDRLKLFAFGIAAVHHAKSNAVAIVRTIEEGSCQLLGIGFGQPNRVDCLERLALPKAIENLKREHPEEGYDPKSDLKDCVLVSDGFFPFDDSVRTLAAAGIGCCIQPGGSTNDQMVIDAADELGVCMVFSGERYFCN